MDKGKMYALIHIEANERDGDRAAAHVQIKTHNGGMAYALGLLLYNIEVDGGDLEDEIFMALQVKEHLKRDKNMVSVDRGMIRRLLGEVGGGHE